MMDTNEYTADHLKEIDYLLRLAFARAAAENWGFAVPLSFTSSTVPSFFEIETDSTLNFFPSASVMPVYRFASPGFT